MNNAACNKIQVSLKSGSGRQHRMDTMNTDVPMCEGAEAVRVGVLLTANPENTDCVVVDVEGSRVDYKSAKNEDTRSFTFDQVVTADSMENLHSKLLQPLPESISNACNAALVMCGATEALMEQRVVRKVLTNLFSRTSQATSEIFTSVSFLQFYPDGSAVDLLSLNKETLELIKHPVLGSVVEGLCEVCVYSAEEALNMYETCREMMKASAGSVFGRCSSLFSVAVEWKLHPERVESDVCRSKLQLFSLAGGASRMNLRGVSPLVKVLDQMLTSSTTDGSSLLLSLLQDALTGNYQTYLVYCINPRGLLNEEAPCALELAQKVRGLLTEAKTGRWNPKASEREIREAIMDLQNKIMSQEESEVHNIYKLAELSQNLKVVKDQTWEKRREESEKIKKKTKSYKSSVSNNEFSGGHLVEHKSSETMKCLQEQLRREMGEHLKEDKGSAEKVQERAERIQQLKDALREETLKSGAISEKSQLCQQSEYNEAQERRRQLKEDHVRLIQEEVAKMEEELAREQPPAESPERELLVLSRQRQVLVLQVQALHAEARQAERDLRDQHKAHQTELHCLREESLQVFRVFRQVSEEQRKVSEGRYRSVLLEAVQDAVYLSAQNQQLQADNKRLRKALGGIKDALAARGDPIADSIPQQE